MYMSQCPAGDHEVTGGQTHPQPHQTGLLVFVFYLCHSGNGTRLARVLGAPVLLYILQCSSSHAARHFSCVEMGCHVEDLRLAAISTAWRHIR